MRVASCGVEPGELAAAGIEAVAFGALPGGLADAIEHAELRLDELTPDALVVAGEGDAQLAAALAAAKARVRLLVLTTAAGTTPAARIADELVGGPEEAVASLLARS